MGACWHPAFPAPSADKRGFKLPQSSGEHAARTRAHILSLSDMSIDRPPRMRAPTGNAPAKWIVLCIVTGEAKPSIASHRERWIASFASLRAMTALITRIGNRRSGGVREESLSEAHRATKKASK